MSADLPMWVVYDHPSDYPDQFVARQHLVGMAGNRPTGRMMTGSLDSIRVALSNVGLVCVPRDEADDPVIVETWL